MAKKFGKFLLFSAMAGAAAAGAYYYLKSKDRSVTDEMDEDDDFDDFGDDLDEDAPKEEKSRSYVDLNLEKGDSAVSQAACDTKDTLKNAAKDVCEAAKDVKDAAKNTAETLAQSAETKVEEFFDDDDDNSADSM